MNKVHESTMWKMLRALVKGFGVEAGEKVVDANAMTILRQQVRESTTAVAAARRELALSVAREREEIRNVERISERIADLEGRAAEAAGGGRMDLAREAARSIARLEDDRNGAAEHLSTAATSIARQRMLVEEAEARLADLHRGVRSAQVREGLMRASSRTAGGVATTLHDAEATLNRLAGRQRLEIDAVEVENAMVDAVDPTVVSGRLADAGFGTAIRTDPKAVLARIIKRRVEVTLNEKETRS